jgi:hypothetical protein
MAKFLNSPAKLFKIMRKGEIHLIQLADGVPFADGMKDLASYQGRYGVKISQQAWKGMNFDSMRNINIIRVEVLEVTKEYSIQE